MSVVGTTIHKLDGTAFYSPSFPRGGLAATFVANVTHLSGTPTVAIEVEHRNQDDTSWTSGATFAAITTTGVKTADGQNLLEILRFKYTFDAGDAATDAIHLIMQAPTWRPYV